MEAFQYVQIVWGAGAVMCLCILIFIGYRGWGVLNWALSLRRELKEIQLTIDTEDVSRKSALSVVESKCRTIINAYSPEIVGYSDLKGYVSEIAACYYPEKENPELNVSVGHVLYSLEKSVQRFNLILSRKGMGRLSHINIRQILTIYNYYNQLIEKPYVKLYLSHRRKIRNISFVRYLIFPDPFALMALLSKNLMVLLMTKYLMVDLYLFVGKLAVDVYDDTVETKVNNIDSDIEETLEELSSLNIENSNAMPYKVAEIRNSFLGVAAVLKKDPGFDQWKLAVIDAASAIASKYFPDKEEPVKEAVIGPLILKSGDWIQTMARGEGIPVAGRLYNTRLSTLYQAKRLTDLQLPSTVETLIVKAQKTYGWVKWPLRAYRIARKFSLWRLAMEVGWATGRKSTLVYLYGRAFDKAVVELDDVYKMSRDPETWLPYFNEMGHPQGTKPEDGAH